MVESRTPEREVGDSCCVLEQRHINSPEVLVLPRKQWLPPGMTEKLLTGTLSLIKTKLSKLPACMSGLVSNIILG